MRRREGEDFKHVGMEKWLGKKGQANLAHVVEYDVLLKRGRRIKADRTTAFISILFYSSFFSLKINAI